MMEQLSVFLSMFKEVITHGWTAFWENISKINAFLAILLAGSAISGSILVYLRRQPRVIFKHTVDQNYGKENRLLLKKYYITTRGQDVDPCNQDEIREDNGKFITANLVSFFCQDAFKQSSQGKYYLVLADSGMGKSTFLLKLYCKYITRVSLRRRKKMVLIPLSKKSCLNSIIALEKKENTILLLDALDENPSAMNDYLGFFSQLLNATEDFYKIVITCRTQFFPNRAEEPNTTGRINPGTGKKSTEIVKKYLSPFTDEDVSRYLNKRYRFRIKARKNASAIISKAPSLMARPIILNWVDFLQDKSEAFEYSFQIYAEIIDRWIEREALQHTNGRLFVLSLSIADYMFSHRTSSIPRDVVEHFASQEQINLSPIVAKSRSLLNRNGNGEYKFAHRSFLEYFMAYLVFNKVSLSYDIDFFQEASNAMMFLREMLVNAIMSHEKLVNKLVDLLSASSYAQASTSKMINAELKTLLLNTVQLCPTVSSEKIVLTLSREVIDSIQARYNVSTFQIIFEKAVRSGRKNTMISIYMPFRNDAYEKGMTVIGELTVAEMYKVVDELTTGGAE